MFVDRVVISLKAGKGGDGIVAWFREKFRPMGGPAGGDGGDGGSIIIKASHDVYALEAFRHQRIIQAENGKSGEGALRQGKKGQDLTLKVPLGTLLKERTTGTILYDFTEDGEEFFVCKGGKRGKGNNHFKNGGNRSPDKCTLGTEGEEREVELELKLIAKVGLVGFPNAGKSTFLNYCTDLKVKAAPYPFTTLHPNLGFLQKASGERIWIADIPGIIEGAHKNKGLGLEFLRHIERTELLLFFVDIAGEEGRDPIQDFAILRKEIEAYNPQLLNKPYLVALNKMDLPEAPEQLERFQTQFQDNIFPLSAVTGEGVEELVSCLKSRI